MKVVILSPHPDDAVLSCWRLLVEEAEIAVVTVFGGKPAPGSPLGSWDALTGARNAEARWRERMQEDRRALELAGCTSRVLPFVDNDYRTDAIDLAELTHAFANLQAQIVYAPAALLGHPDHIAVRDGALALGGSDVEVRLFADQPHANVFGWPGWVTGAREHRFVKVEELWASNLRQAGIELDQLRPRVHRLDAAWAGKQDAIAAYRTQAPVLSRLASKEDLRFEVEWSRR